MEQSEQNLGIAALTAQLRARLEGRQNVSLAERRKAVDAIANFGAPDNPFTPADVTIADVPAARFDPAHPSRKGLIIHAHGGAFVAGSARSHQYIAGSLATMTGVPVVVPDYRLAPEHPFPAALDDITAVVRELQQRREGPVALLGDSAGAALILGAACRLRDDGHSDLAALAVISPFVDLSCDNETYQSLASADPFITGAGLRKDVQAYLAGADPAAPEASPLFADLRGLPPLLIQVGSSEVLLGDSRALKDAADQAGLEVRLRIWPQMIHVWHLFPRYLKESDAAIRELASFLLEHMAG